MLKVNLTKDILDRHRIYYDENVNSKLKSFPNGTAWTKFNKRLKKNKMHFLSLDKVKNKDKRAYDSFISFLQFCHGEKEILAVGKMNELKKLKPNLEKMYDSFRHIDILSEAVVYAFGYDDFANSHTDAKTLLQTAGDVADREWCAYTFVISLGLRVCPYCNEQYIAPTLAENGKVRGDLDHFLPKSKYPYFALSIYNMIPCCKFCNSSLKLSKDFDNPKTATPYEVSYNDCFKFWGVKEKDKWAIRIKEDENIGMHVSEILKIFLIKERYMHHTDIVKDYLKKKKEYSDRLLENIKKAYSSEHLCYFLSDYFGYPLKAEDIDKNVLNKFKRDLAENLLHHQLM